MFYLTRASFCVFGVFSAVCFVLSVPVQVIAWKDSYRVLTSLENLEISGNFVNLENSGNLKCTQGIFGSHYYQRQKCRPMTSF